MNKSAPRAHALPQAGLRQRVPERRVGFLPEGFGPVAEVAVCKHDAGLVARDPQVGAGHAEVADGVGGHAVAGPVRGLLPLDLKTEAPRARLLHAITRDDAAQVTELVRKRLAHRRRVKQPGLE